MANNISGYPTKKTGAETPNYVTVTECTDGSDKVALDVAICEGTVTTTPGDTPSENPDTGDTVHVNDSVDTTATSFPTVAGGTITSMLIEIPDQGDTSIRMYVSFDGGTSFKTLKESSSMTWSPRGGLTQLVLKSNKATPVDFEMILNRNP